ncbi:MAG: hypothetical protein NTW33_09250 [Methanoregula sp.]|nr:hypothetical protein [Methanoregula sp.]
MGKIPGGRTSPAGTPHLLSPSCPFLLYGNGAVMAGALAVEGWIIGLFVIIDGIYVVAFPPVNDEVQGYAIIAIGIFIILATLHLSKIMENAGECQRLP